LVEQLYTGSQRALAVVALSNEVPTHLADVLRRLAMLPQRFQELRRASARAGAIAALSRAKAFLPELDPADIALGYPSLKEDGTPFDQKDFDACVKSVRPVATLIGNDTDLTKYQPGNLFALVETDISETESKYVFFFITILVGITSS